MSRTLLVRLSAGVIALGCAWVAYTQAPAPQGKQQAKQPNNTISKVADDLYAIIGDGGNSTVYVTNEGVILWMTSSSTTDRTSWTRSRA
jgi:hypothetical protein